MWSVFDRNRTLYHNRQHVKGDKYLIEVVECVLFLSNTDHLQQVDDCGRVFYFYQILTTFNKLMIVVEFVLFLSNTDHLQQVDDCGRGI
jgi:hypothetical protein